MFATCIGLYISSRCSCTDIAGACIYGCTCTTTAATLFRELAIPASIPWWAGHRHFWPSHAWLGLGLADVVGDCISICQPGSLVCIVCKKRQYSHGGSRVDTSSPRRAQTIWWWAMLMATVLVDDVYSCMWMFAASWIGPLIVPRPAPACKTFPDNALISWASRLRASHDLRRHARCHIRCMRASQSDNNRHHLPGRGVACWCQCT